MRRHRRFELVTRDRAGAVGVDRHEELAQLVNLVRRRSEGEQLERHLVQPRRRREGLKRAHHLRVLLQLLRRVGGRRGLGAGDPRVAEGLGGSEPLLRRLVEQRLHKVDRCR